MSFRRINSMNVVNSARRGLAQCVRRCKRCRGCKVVVGLQTVGGEESKTRTRPKPPTGGEGGRGRRTRTTEGWPRTTGRKPEPKGTRFLAPLVTDVSEGGRFPAPRPTRDGCFFRPEVQKKKHKNIKKRHDTMRCNLGGRVGL